MTAWQDSRSTDKRHTHTLIRNSAGQDICSGCWQVVTEPITSSDDPRLQGAGLMRSPHHNADNVIVERMPLPQLLIALYNEGPEFGFARAPAAPYVLAIIELHVKRRDDLGELWLELSNKS